MASFGLDPVGCLNRHFDPRLGAVEIKRSSKNPRRILFIHGPEHNREYLLQSKRFKTSGLWPVRASSGSAQSNLRNHPLKTHGDEHSDFDRLIDPYFNRRAIERNFELIGRLTVEEVEKWRPGVHDFYELARRCTGRVAFSILFGEQHGQRFEEFGDLLHHYHRANWSSAQVVRMDLPGTRYRQVLSRAQAVQDYLFSWMRLRSAGGEAQSLFERMFDTPRGNGCPYSEHTTASTVALVSWLAFETTATVLSWTVLLLAQHPAILSDLVDELSAHEAAVAGDSAGILSLPLLDAVVKEAMRLITPVPVVSFRMGTAGEIAGQHFAENSRFYVLPFLTHRNPDLYAEPDRFRPERWFSVKPSAYEYLPFGGGQRRCPGYWLAMVNLKVVLNEMLRRFRPSSPAGARVDRKYAVVLMPKAGVPIELVPKGFYDPSKIVPSVSGSIFDLFVPEADRPVRH